jgi:hypothetical protein
VRGARSVVGDKRLPALIVVEWNNIHAVGSEYVWGGSLSSSYKCNS